MDVIVLHQCQKELGDFPEEILGHVLDAIARLRAGLLLSMPLSRPIPSIGKGVHELRLRDHSGVYRVIYVLKVKDAIYLVHAFRKSTQATSQKNLDVAKQRIKRL